MRTLFVIGLILCSLSLSAQLRLPTFFADHMVLQQNTHNAIWGFSKANEQVKVSTSWGEEEVTRADKDGRWKVFVKTPGYATGQKVVIKGANETIALNPVAIGEVWLCLGQSNMGWALRNCFNWEEESKRTDNTQLRIYKSDRQHWYEPKKDCVTGKWKVSNLSSAGATSAVAWHFGNALQKQLGIPVGIIVQAYAGTPVEGWMPWEAQKDILRSQYHKEGLDKTTQRQIEKLGLTKEKALNAFEKEVAEYHQKMAMGDTMKSKNKALMYPIITKPAMLGHQYPAHIYNAMVHPLLGYGIKGIIWYQGERNSKTVQQALAFKEQLSTLIDFYRETWYTHAKGHVEQDFYFSITQLPSWGRVQVDPVEGIEAPWTVTRQMMLELAKEKDNVGVAVSIDTGNSVELHPKNKKPIGLRHAFNVLHDVYGLNSVGHGPYYSSHKIVNDTIEISFDGCGSGLKAAHDKPLDAFAIAGADQQWKWAEAKIKGNKIMLYSNEVKQPVAVRYAWGMNPSQRNLLYNNEGFPASPFRTDDWELYMEGETEVKVFKPKKDKGFVSVDWERPVMKPIKKQALLGK